MVYIIDENLLESDCDVIAHQVDCLMKFGSGIADQIKTKYPRAHKAFLKDDRYPVDKLGKFSLSDHGLPKIFNLYGQGEYSAPSHGHRYTDYAALESSLVAMLDEIENLEKKAKKKFKIGLPHNLGCGSGGGEWEIVEKIIVGIFEDFDKDVYLYRYNQIN